jgi:YidC/Oxa1 family membrane protein insertase
MSVLTLLIATLSLLTPRALSQDEQPEASTQEAPTISAPSFVARPAEPDSAPFASLGDLDDEAQRVYLEFTPFGAGIKSIQLPDEFETVKFEKHITLQAQQVEGGTHAVPFGATWVVINGENVSIGGSEAAPLWNERAPGVFELFVDDTEGNPVLRIERRFELKPENRHGFILSETLENLSDQPLRAVLNTTAMIDMPKADSTYGGDRRRIRYGYMLPPEQQGTSLRVRVDDELMSRNKLLGKRTAGANGVKEYSRVRQIWPDDKLLPNSQRLSWLGFTDRYFAVILHPVFDPNTVSSADAKTLDGIAKIDRYVLDTTKDTLNSVQLLTLQGEQVELESGASNTRVLGVYAGMRNKPIMNAEPVIASLNMPDMVVSNLGGICAPCTFQWLAHILMDVLRTFHMIVGDWGISIIMLVLLVKACLHPVARWSQIRLQKFTVQMQALAPKQKAIREKYKDDSKRQQAEMAKLWKEEGINPAGALGCLPMFLQMPVWVALYATLFFATELRHEPAFYGIFQQINGWGFMSDLAAPDGAIPLPTSWHFSFPLWGTVSSLNLLPLLMGVLMWAHQKYLTPPSTATLTPEQQSQQKMMKVMMVFMFPVMMYAAPSGLALYFITNSTVGIFENKWIRHHMKKHGMLEIENIKAEKKKKGPGFMQRMMEAAEAQKQIREKGPGQINPAAKEFNRRPKK